MLTIPDVNLDAMEESELREYAAQMQIILIEARKLMSYAVTKSHAIQSRKTGNIVNAQLFEAACNALYSQLRPESRTW